MEKGFTIKCNKCGSELKLNTLQDFYEAQYNNAVVTVYVEWSFEEGCFECECGNEVIF